MRPSPHSWRQPRGGKECWGSSVWDRSKKRLPNELGPEAWRTGGRTQRPRWQCAPIGPFSAFWAYFSPFFCVFLSVSARLSHLRPAPRGPFATFRRPLPCLPLPQHKRLASPSHSRARTSASSTSSRLSTSATRPSRATPATPDICRLIPTGCRRLNVPVMLEFYGSDRSLDFLSKHAGNKFWKPYSSIGRTLTHVSL